MSFYTDQIMQAKQLTNEDGAFGLTAVAMLAFMLVFAAFVIDLGYAWVAKNKLQDIADSAALAAARELGRFYEGLSLPDQQNFFLTDTERTQIIAAANAVAQQQIAGGQSITINNADVVIGVWDVATSTLTPTNTRPTALQIVSRRDDSANGPIPTFFANAIGVTSLSVSKATTAALLPISSVPPGEIDLPVCISKAWFDSGGSCPDTIKFHPTGTLDGCAGWTTFDEPRPMLRN